MLAATAQPTQSGHRGSEHRGSLAGPRHPIVLRGLDGFGPYVLDPITQLVAFPSFHERFPRVFARELARGRTVGIAIGDVDGLKSYVERSRAMGDLSFGHLAGNDLMTRLGRTSLAWFAGTEPAGCLATFGGDEVILVMTGLRASAFGRNVRELSRRLSAALPCTVSFAHATFSAEHASAFALPHYQRALVLVDRALFAAKKRPGGARVVGLRPRAMDGSGWRVARRHHAS